MEDPIAELVELLARLPGIGERTATRLAYHVLGADPLYAKALGASLDAVHARVRRCALCANYTAHERCRVCSDPGRDARTLCVVARVQDLAALERSGTFRGRYHVLHALLSPLDGVGPEAIDLATLAHRVESEGIAEVVVATPLSVEGEATALYVAQALRSTAARVNRSPLAIPGGDYYDMSMGAEPGPDGKSAI